MATIDPNRKQERFDLRVAPSQAAAIRVAARQTERTVTAFLIETAVEEARRILSDSSHFVLEDAEWTAFHSMLERPATFKPKLAALLESDGDITP